MLIQEVRFPLATIGALDPLACVQVRLREHAMASTQRCVLRLHL